MYNIEDMLMEKNYSKCPLKKRPIYYNFDGDDSIIDTQNLGNIIVSFKMDSDEPENLSLKKEKCELLSSSTEEELISINDCCEDEGVDVDHTDDDSVCNDEDEVINCVDVEDNHNEDANKTQAAALSAAAAVAAASVTVVVPTPTYPEYVLKPWNFHINSYTAEFYRSMSNPHLTKQISPLSGELLSPSSPPDSIGSLSPPPHHYLHGRSNSVSPPMRVDMAHRSLGARQLSCQIAEHHNQQRFISYPLSGYPTHHQPSLSYAIAGYPPQRHHAPISPAYSDSSYYSMRSLTPESLASPLPEDLSLKASSCNSIKDYQKANKHKMKEVETATAFQQTTAALSAGTQGIKEKGGSPRYQCPDCLKSYSTFSGLTKHQQFHCPAAERNQVKKSFSCKDCDKTYVTLGALKMHIRTHTLPCKCNICGKAFSRPWLLQGHIRTHTGEKPFSCQHCFRAFADRSNLRAHLQTHSDIKKYSCSHCSKTFSRMSLLTKHSEGGCQGSSNSANAPNSSTVSINGYPVYNKN